MNGNFPADVSSREWREQYEEPEKEERDYDEAPIPRGWNED